MRSTSPVRRLARLLHFAVVTIVLALSVTRAPMAAPTVQELAERLRSASDFRVRVQAALALGASKSPDAVRPLCSGLTDTNASVRGAAAAGLGKLRDKAGLTCVKNQLRSESNEAVKAQLNKAAQEIESTAVRAPTANSKWYVAIGKTKNKSERNSDEVDAIVQETLRKVLEADPAFALAPASETPAQATQVIQRFRLVGFFLQPTVEAPQYGDSKLTVIVRVTTFTYPNKAFQGEVAPKLTQSGTPTKDVASENELIKLAVERAANSFVKNVQAFKP